jgi:hypothetical protein
MRLTERRASLVDNVAMRKNVGVAVVALLLAAPVARAQSVTVEVGPPPIRFEAPPPLVEVSPGVQVVPDQEQEVYFVDGWYWTRHGNRWYRARDHRGGWVVAEERAVPQTIVVLPRGRYRHWKGGPKRGVMVTPTGEVVKYKVKKGKHK